MVTISNHRQLGAAIRAERKKRGLSQAALAEKSRVSRAWLARFETGHPTARLDQVFRALHALDLEMALTERQISDAEEAVLAALARKRKQS